ncbi:MAG: twin-arginine translocase TatA/TatE family subunit [Armatimonadota bacterium]
MIVQSAVGLQEMWPIALIIVVLFGAKRIPEMMKGVGEGMREFKKASSELNDEPAARDLSATAENK